MQVDFFGWWPLVPWFFACAALTKVWAHGSRENLSAARSNMILVHESARRYCPDVQIVGKMTTSDIACFCFSSSICMLATRASWRYLVIMPRRCHQACPDLVKDHITIPLLQRYNPKPRYAGICQDMKCFVSSCHSHSSLCGPQKPKHVCMTQRSCWISSPEKCINMCQYVSIRVNAFNIYIYIYAYNIYIYTRIICFILAPNLFNNVQ